LEEPEELEEPEDQTEPEDEVDNDQLDGVRKGQL
jgi:hypothetical protein